MRSVLGWLAWSVGVGGWLAGTYFLLRDSQSVTALAPIQAVEFAACGSTAGILLVKSDGSTTWYRPPFEGLQQAAEGLPDDAQFKVDYCPETVL